jgi:hypothetical protein
MMYDDDDILVLEHKSFVFRGVFHHNMLVKTKTNQANDYCGQGPSVQSCFQLFVRKFFFIGGLQQFLTACLRSALQS